MNTNKPHIIFQEDSKISCFDEWLKSTELRLIENGYTKYNQQYKLSDFQYFKSFQIGGRKVYQIAVCFYDFRKFNKEYNTPDKISINFDCLLLNEDGRVDLSISLDDVTLEVFESISLDFYKCMKRNLNKLKTTKKRKKSFISKLKPIVDDVMCTFNIKENRERLNVYNKKYLFYFLRRRLSKHVPFEEIGSMCGYNHSNVMHHIKDAEYYIETKDVLFTESIEPLKQYLESKFEIFLKK